MDNYIKLVFTVVPPYPYTDLLFEELAQIGFDAFENEEEYTAAYIKEKDFSQQLLDELPLLKNVNVAVSFKKENIQGKNWNEVWEKSFEPVLISDKVMIRAPFHMPAESVLYDIIIEPKMSFGTGHHPTTCLMIENMLKIKINNKNVLDLGCGTGILSVMASKLGAKSIMAVDTEEQAVLNTRENLLNNNVVNTLVEKGTANDLQSQSFHVILANINKNVLINTMEYFSKSLMPGGMLLLSGFFESDNNDLLQIAEANKLHFVSALSKDHWSSLCLTKN